MSYVQSTNPTSAVSPDTTHGTQAYASNNAAGNTLTTLITWDTSAGASVTLADSQGNIWTQVDTQIDAANTQRASIFIALNCNAGANTVTATFTANKGTWGMICAEHTASAGVDVHPSQFQTTNTGATDEVTSTAATTAGTEDLIGYFINTQLGIAVTAGTGYTLRQSNTGNGLGYLETIDAATAGSKAATLTASNTVTRWLSFLIALLPGGAAPAPNVGSKSTNRHPGAGPGRARFIQTPRSTDIISTSQDALTTPATVVAIAGVGTVVTQGGTVATPSTVVAIAGVGTVIAQGGAATTPSTVVVTAGVSTVAAQGGAVVVPSTVVAVAVVPAPTVVTGGDALVTPATVVAIASVGAVLAQGGAGVALATVVAIASVGTPVIQAGAKSTPATVVAIAAIGAAQAQGGAKALPSTVVAVAGVGTPNINTGSTVTPATVVAVATVPAPSLGGSTTVSPATVAAVAAVGAVVIHTSALILPATVVATAAIATPTAQGGAKASPLTVSTIAAIPTPSVGPVGPATNNGAGFLIILGPGAFR